MLSGKEIQPLIVDFYKNIHRKYLTILTTSFHPPDIIAEINNHQLDDYVRRAVNILLNKETAKLLLKRSDSAY